MREEVVAAWLAVGKDVAVISHESALELHDLSDVIPYQVHLTVPRSIRNHPKLAGVKIHTTMRGLGSKEIVQREGMSVTSETRSIVDAAETGTGPEQIEMAVYQALRRGVTTGEELSAATRGRSKRTQQLIERAVEIAQSS
jgi:predicted transcriptional regulator of viral defense system